MVNSLVYPWESFKDSPRSPSLDRTNNWVEGVVARVDRDRAPYDTQTTLPEFPDCVRLDFEDLERFEVVRDQFLRWGIEFDNAIAVCPSNPAYPTHSGEILLMGAPQGGFLEMKFTRAVEFVSAFVTSCRIVAMSAYNDLGQTLTRAELPSANLAGSDSAIPPNYQLIVKAPNIYRVTFYAIDAQLTVDDISFG
ncbi:MAG: hypothetical protein J7641_10310 [Cyanobacteria bacterium SID2]|nr:hypothetical protein [Cyanobacteria bacterium SID2]